VQRKEDAYLMTRLEKAYTGVSKELAGEKAIEILLLSDDQMLIRKHMVPNPEPAGFKTPALVPTAAGYAIYVSCRLPSASEERPVQRVTFPAQPVPWDEAGMTLHLDHATLDQSWQLLNHVGERISVTVHCGSEQVFDEVDHVLALVATSLFG
jgi:hypothetical protein